MSGESIRASGFLRFSLANILQLILMASLALNWWAGKESSNAAVAATQAVLIQGLSDRVTKLEEANKQFSSTIQDVQNKVNILVAVAEEQRKKQK